MTQTILCPHCHKPFTCNPDGECWCKAYPPLEIPEALKGEQCLCRCVLDKLAQEQKPEPD